MRWRVIGHGSGFKGGGRTRTAWIETDDGHMVDAEGTEAEVEAYPVETERWRDDPPPEWIARAIEREAEANEGPRS